MAAVSGTVLWSSASGKMASAQEQDDEPGDVQKDAKISAGCGLADMTGEPWGAGMNGYAVIEQTSVGIHRRQYARAFVFAEDANPDKRTVLVVADMGLMFQSIFMEVLRRLKKKFGDMYR